VWDEALFAAGITSANIACGAHAGDAVSMAKACALAARHGVAIGAHPGHADPANFGRRVLPLRPDAAESLLATQLRALREEATRVGARLRHVKPHGALYHQFNDDLDLAERLVAATARECPGAALFGPPEGEIAGAAARAGMRFVAEGFVDRAYRPDGGLVPRGEPGAVLRDPAQAAAQALALARSGRVRTLCVHGDGPAALRLLGVAREALLAAGFRIAAPPG
jgi:UPF0271 protein